MNAMPFNKITPAAITTGFKTFKGPTILAAAEHRVREGVQGGTRRVRQPDPVLQLHRQGCVEGRHDLAEAARGEVDTTTEHMLGPATAGPSDLVSY